MLVGESVELSTNVSTGSILPYMTSSTLPISIIFAPHNDVTKAQI